MTDTTPTVAELKDRAGELEIDGRSNMSKAELEQAIAAREAELAAELEGLRAQAATRDIPGYAALDADALRAAIEKADEESARSVGPSERPSLADVAAGRYTERAMRTVHYDTPEAR